MAQTGNFVEVVHTRLDVDIVIEESRTWFEQTIETISVTFQKFQCDQRVPAE